MKRSGTNSKLWIGLIGAMSLVLSATAVAGNDNPSGDDGTAPGAYNIDQNTGQNTGPVRLASFTLVDGSVSWRPSADLDWSSASVNLPIRTGGQISVDDGSRAEIQFDDGSVVRLSGGSVATLQTMYSDDKGEFTEVKLTSGVATLRLKSDLSEYQVDTPLNSIKSYGPSNVRIDVGNAVDVAVRSGEAQVEGGQGSVTLHSQDFLDVPDDQTPYNVVGVPAEDSWDRFNDDRDYAIDHPSRNLPTNIALVAGNLDGYGTWRHDPQYGQVWLPRVRDDNWRPYHDGRWVWVNPFGWTWVADEPWGWAPYHYGTWVHASYGWGWCPGPAQQYWSPAVVQFTEDRGNIAWCALAPSEVRYPSELSIGFRSGNWALSFSIGGCASYYSSGRDYYEPRRWDNRDANRVTNITNVTNVTNVYNNNTYTTNNYVPINARNPGGITATSTANFARGGNFEAVKVRQPDLFARGRSFAAPQGTAQFSGPVGVLPNRNSLTPTHTFGATAPASSLLNRRVVRSPLPPSANRFSAPVGQTVAPSTHRGGYGSNPSIASNAGRTNGLNRDPLPPTYATSAPRSTVTNSSQDRYSRFNSVARQPARSVDSGPVNLSRGQTSVPVRSNQFDRTIQPSAPVSQSRYDRFNSSARSPQTQVRQTSNSRSDTAPRTTVSRSIRNDPVTQVSAPPSQSRYTRFDPVSSGLNRPTDSSSGRYSPPAAVRNSQTPTTYSQPRVFAPSRPYNDSNSNPSTSYRQNTRPTSNPTSGPSRSDRYTPPARTYAPPVRQSSGSGQGSPGPSRSNGRSSSTNDKSKSGKGH